MPKPARRPAISAIQNTRRFVRKSCVRDCFLSRLVERSWSFRFNHNYYCFAHRMNSLSITTHVGRFSSYDNSEIAHPHLEPPNRNAGHWTLCHADDYCAASTLFRLCILQAHYQSFSDEKRAERREPYSLLFCVFWAANIADHSSTSTPEALASTESLSMAATYSV